jgi:hypothetical protein
MGDMPLKVTLMRMMKTTVMARGSTVGQENRTEATEAMEEVDTGTIIAATKTRIMKRMKMMRTRKMREKKRKKGTEKTGPVPKKKKFRTNKIQLKQPFFLM